MEQSQEENRTQDRQGTPERPPYSPVTPVLSQLATVPGGASILAPYPETSPTTVYTNPGDFSGAYHANDRQRQPPVITPEPSPVPISESDNPDVIALRSAISILQLQKQQSLKDIKALDRMKNAAASDPEKFAQELVAGRLSSPNQDNLVYLLPPGENRSGGDEADGVSPQTREDDSGFQKLPQPQNVVRMPPINWAKYQIVGEPLDRMHEEQRHRPFSGDPRRGDTFQRAPEHVIAAPYRPLTDKLESPTKVRGTRKDKKTSDSNRGYGYQQWAPFDCFQDATDYHLPNRPWTRPGFKQRHLWDDTEVQSSNSTPAGPEMLLIQSIHLALSDESSSANHSGEPVIHRYNNTLANQDWRCEYSVHVSPGG